MEITTPDQVIRELNRLMAESSRGIQVMYEAETKVAELELAHEKVFQEAFLATGGTVADRTAVAKLKAADARFAWDLARIELNRVKAKLKQLSDAGTLTAVIAKQVELAMRNA